MNSSPEAWNGERTGLALEALQRSGVLRLQLRGLSMLPSLWPGDEVEIARCSAAELRRGDITLAMRDQRFFLHRVFALSVSGEVITRGDAMPRPDAEFPSSAVLGKVVRLTRDGKMIPVSRGCSPITRAVGMLFCYSGFFRNAALRLHNRRLSTAQDATLGNTTSDPEAVQLCNLTSEL